MDAAVNALTNQNVNILHCFGWPPSWATTCTTCAPTNIQDWDDFITAFVTRYHTRVKYLEVWNESMAGEGFFTGTTTQLVQLAQHLYTITKSIDPTVTVLTADATGGKANMTQFYSSYFAAGGGAYADVIAFHGYCSLAGVNQITYPEEIIGIVNALQGAMNSYGQSSKPIFCTEGDWGSEGTGANCPTPDDCVAFLARHYLLQWSLGVSSYAWYAWDNNNGNWQWGQLWTPTNGLNAAGIAYQQLYGWMVGATMTQPYIVQGSVYTCGFTRPGGYQALAVWTTNRSAPSQFTVPSGYVQYRDLAGNLQKITGTTVTIGIKPILLENTNGITPAISGLTSHTNAYGVPVALTGTVSADGAYPPSGTMITVNVNGSPQTTNIYDSTGDFAINYTTLGLPASSTPYTITYASAAALGFNPATDTSTTLEIMPRGGPVAVTNWVGVFNSSADTANWVPGNSGAASFLAGDAPPGGPSSGSLLFQGPYGPGLGDWNGIINNSLNLNATNCTALEFDAKIEGSLDNAGGVGGIEIIMGSPTYNPLPYTTYTGATIKPVATNSGWQHFVIPASDLDNGNIAEWVSIGHLEFYIYDGGYAASNLMAVAYDNIKFTGPGTQTPPVAPTPVLSGFKNRTNTYGSSVTLTGTVSDNGVYPAVGTVITVTINGTPQTTTLSDSTGDFSIHYNTASLPASATPYTVAYSSPAGGGFNAATDSSTTLTIVAPPELSGMLASNSQLVFSYPTLVGQNYQLQYCTNLASGLWLPASGLILGSGALIWATNSLSAMLQQFFRLSITQ